MSNSKLEEWKKKYGANKTETEDKSSALEKWKNKYSTPSQEGETVNEEPTSERIISRLEEIDRQYAQNHPTTTAPVKERGFDFRENAAKVGVPSQMTDEQLGKALSKAIGLSAIHHVSDSEKEALGSNYDEMKRKSDEMEADVAYLDKLFKERNDYSNATDEEINAAIEQNKGDLLKDIFSTGGERYVSDTQITAPRQEKYEREVIDVYEGLPDDVKNRMADISPFYDPLTKQAVISGKGESSISSHREHQKQVASSFADVKNELYSLGYNDDDIHELLLYSRILSNAESANKISEDLKKATTGELITANLESIPANLTSGVGQADITLQTWRNRYTKNYRPVDYYTPATERGRYAREVRKETSERIDNPVVDFIYNTGMSIADSATSALVAGQYLAPILLAGSAGLNTIYDAKERGLSDMQAVNLGMAASVNEALFEKIPIDHFFKGINNGATKNLLVQILTQGAIEGSEEVGTSLANQWADKIIAADKSQFNVDVAKYMQDGLTKEEAEQKAALDFFLSLGIDFLGGLVSGGAFGSFGYAANRISNRFIDDKYAKDIKQDKETLDALITEGKEIGGDSAKIATDIENTITKGKEASTAQIKKLVKANDKGVKAQEALEEAADEIIKEKASSTPVISRLEAMSSEGEQISVEDVKRATGFGNFGAEAVAKAVNENKGSFVTISDEMRVYYEAGRANSKVNPTTDIQRDAYTAGLQDRELGRMKAVEGISDNKVFSYKESGLITPESENKGNLNPVAVPKSVSQGMVKALDYIGKATGRKVMFVDDITASNGTSKADASVDNNGVFKISANAKKQLHKLVLHEPVHIMQQEYTQEYQDFADFALENAELLGYRLELENGTGTAFERLYSTYEAKGLKADADLIVGEVVARFAEKLANNDQEAISLIEKANETPKSRNAIQRFFDLLRKWIEKLKNLSGNLKNIGEYSAAKQIDNTVVDIEKGRELYVKAFKATAQAAQERGKTKAAQKNTDTEGADTHNKSFSLQDSEYLELAKDPEKNEARLREMVDEAAREAGYTVKAYHGTGTDFNIFSEEKVGGRNVWGKGFYFGTSKGIADDYASWRESQGGKYRIVSAYLKMENPFTPHKSSLGTAEEILDRWFSDMWQTSRDLGIGYIEGKLENSPLDLLQFIAEHNNVEVRDILAEYGYDSVKDGGELVVFKPQQIKSADTITYDDNDNIIPISKRFDNQEVDIRYSLQDDSGHSSIALEKFGTTDTFEKTGFVTANGKMLNLSRYGQNGVQHKIIEQIYDDVKGADAITRFINEGNVRISAAGSGIEISADTKPTVSQFNAISRFASQSLRKRDVFYVDVVDKSGDRVGTMEYSSDDDVEDIMYDVKEYYSTGRIPQRTTAWLSLQDDIDISTEETKAMLDTIAQLKHEFELTKFAKADPKKLEAMTKKLLKDYDSKADTDETTKAIDKLYEYIANGEDGEQPVWNEVYNKAYEISKNIVENAVVTNDYDYKTYKSLRQYLSTTPMKFDSRYDEVPTAYENFNDFRKKNMGRLRFTNDGIGIDSVYAELSNQYPDFFDAEEEVATSDILGRIVDVLDSIQPTEVNPFSADMKEATANVANDIIDRFFDVPQAKPTFADKAERRVLDARIAGQKKVEKIREQRNEKIRKLIESQREKTKAILQKAREDKAKAVAETRQKGNARVSKLRESQKAKVLRARIMRHASDLSQKLVRPSDNQHIPKNLQGAVATLLESINLESSYAIVPYANPFVPNEITSQRELFKTYAVARLDVEKSKPLGVKRDTIYQARADIVHYVQNHDDVAQMLGVSPKEFEQKLKTWERNLSGRNVKRDKISDGYGSPTKRTEAFEALRKVYAEIKETAVIDPDLLGEDGLLSDVIEMRDKRIADMNSQELEIIWKTMRAIEATISTANKLFSQSKFAAISEIAGALMFDNAGKNVKKEFRGVLGKGQKLTGLDMLTPETYFHYLGEAGDSIFRMMRDAQDKHISIMKEVADFTRKTLNGVNVNKLEKTVHTVKLGGENVKLTTAQLMELYVLMNREQAVDHILVGGILPDEIEKGVFKNSRPEPIRKITQAEIGEALSKLSAEEKTIADELQKFVSTTLAAYGNEASMKVYNYEKFLEKNYWTIRTNKQEIASDIGKDTAVTSVANKGMAKGTKPNANTSVRIGSIFDTFSAHSSDMATYAAWLGTSEDVNRIRNFVFWADGVRTGTIKGVLDTVHGTQGSAYLQKLLTDIAIGVKGTDNMNPFDKFIGNYKAASVGANRRVVIQQPTAILRALDMIDAKYLAASGVHSLKGWEKAKKYAPIAQWKDWGHFDINTGRQMKDILFDNASVLEKTKQAAMWGASMADSVSWGTLWNAVEAETKATHKELKVGSEEYYKVVAKRFTEIVDHTQVVDGILQRSQIMRSPDALTKIATSFMGEPTKQYNMAIAAVYDARTSTGNARKKAVARLGRTAISLAVAGLVNAAAQSLVDALRDDDKEKDYWEKWLSALWGDGEETGFFSSNLGDTINPLGYVPFVKDVVSIMQGYDVKRMDTEAITKTFNAITNMYKAITGTGKYTVAEASAALFAESARLFGLPVANVKRDIKSIAMTTAIESENYLMQYRMEKAMLDINYAGNSKNFMDILFNAYTNDRAAYQIIYKDMLKSGYDADKIQSGMETRMKKAEGVKEASDLSKRYMTPETEKRYDKSLKQIKTSNAWKSANAEQRKEAEADLYNFLTSTSEVMEKARTEAKNYDADEVEYTLWQLAKEIADSDNNNSMNAKEKAAAIELLNLGDSEIAFFYGTDQADEAYSFGIDMTNYAMFKSAVSGLKGNDKEAKVKAYAKKYANTTKEYLYFMGTVYSSWKKRNDYIGYFGRN